ncbi:MAG: hypothetical protein ACPHXS_04400 [Flavobacteriaceae bacterium]|jgi:hypothetical protein
MARTSYGSGLGNAKVQPIGDNRYGLREEYDPKVKRETLEYYRTGHNLTVKEVKNPLTQKVKTVKAK